MGNITKQAELDKIVAEIRERYVGKSIPDSIAKLCDENSDLITEKSLRNLIKIAYNQEIRAFLVEQKLIELNEGGRPVSTDFHGIVNTLLSRYPEGAKFEKIDDLKADNPDLAPKFKTLSNNATKVFGMGLVVYFREIGLLSPPQAKPKTVTVKPVVIKETPEEIIQKTITTLKERYSNQIPLVSIEKLIDDNKDLPISKVRKLIPEVIGKPASEYLQEEGVLRTQEQIKKSIADKYFPNENIYDMRSYALESFVRSLCEPFECTDVKGKHFTMGRYMDSAVRKAFESLGAIVHTSSAKSDYIIFNGKYEDYGYKKDLCRIIENALLLRESGSNVKIVSLYDVEIALENLRSAINSNKIQQKVGSNILPKKSYPYFYYEIEEEKIAELQKSEAFMYLASRDCESLPAWYDFDKYMTRIAKEFPEAEFRAFHYRPGTDDDSPIMGFYSPSGKSQCKDVSVGIVDLWDGEYESLYEAVGFNELKKACEYLDIDFNEVNSDNEYRFEVMIRYKFEQMADNEWVKIFNLFYEYEEAKRENEVSYNFEGETVNIDGVIFSKDMTVLVDYPKDKEGMTYVIPNGVKTIEYYSFGSCTNLQSIVMPDSVTTIGEGAFFDCDDLESIVIPDNVTSIGDNAFSDCKKLQSIVIPDSVASISSDAFEGCENLKNATYKGVMYSYDTNRGDLPQEFYDAVNGG